MANNSPVTRTLLFKCQAVVISPGDEKPIQGLRYSSLPCRLVASAGKLPVEVRSTLGVYVGVLDREG